MTRPAPTAFPPAKAAAFARMPPAVFVPVLGLLALGMALRRVLVAHGLGSGGAGLILGAGSALWAFALIGYAVKLARRPGVLWQDLRNLPGQAGLAAAGMGGMVVAAALAGLSLPLARGLLCLSLGLHLLQGLAFLRVWWGQPPLGRDVTPVWHLSFVGGIVGAVAALPLGWPGLAMILLGVTLPIALLIWLVSLMQLARRIPPAPLRPLLAIHLAPAALFAQVLAGLGQGGPALGFAILAGVILMALALRLRWITSAGFSPFWAAFTFPLASTVSAAIAVGWLAAGAMLAALAVLAIPVIAWRMLRLWPRGRLAARTNAAEA